MQAQSLVNDNFILVADASGIIQIDLETHESEIVLVTDIEPTSVTYDPNTGRVYWSEYDSGTIKRAFLDGSDIEVVVSAAGLLIYFC